MGLFGGGHSGRGHGGGRNDRNHGRGPAESSRDLGKLSSHGLSVNRNRSTNNALRPGRRNDGHSGKHRGGWL